MKTAPVDSQRFFRIVRGRLVQFGLHNTPEIAARWYGATIPDDWVDAATEFHSLVDVATGERVCASRAWAAQAIDDPPASAAYDPDATWHSHLCS